MRVQLEFNRLLQACLYGLPAVDPPSLPAGYSYADSTRAML